MLDQIQADIRDALRNKRWRQAEVLRTLWAELQSAGLVEEPWDNAAGLAGVSIWEGRILEIVRKYVARLQQTLALAADHDHIVGADTAIGDLDTLERYLRPMLLEEELLPLIDRVADEAGVHSVKGSGVVMGALLPSVRGRVVPETLHALVRERLRGRG